MAIFGAGSIWDLEEKKDVFFLKNNFVIGWGYQDAIDLYDAVSLLKAGDIIYLKSNQSGARIIKVKGIGIVSQTFIHSLVGKTMTNKINFDRNTFDIKVKWIIKDEFYINIPESEGKLTNVRAATFYEEFLPFVQEQIIKKLCSKIETICQ